MSKKLGCTTVLVVMLVALTLLVKSCPPSNIVKFKLAEFVAKADERFFYSGDELRYSDHIGAEGPVLLRGKFSQYVVSPDNQKLAIVADNNLMIVGTTSILRNVTPVEPLSVYTPTPRAAAFFRDHGFQWSRDSAVLYLVRDENRDALGMPPVNGELWKYEVDAGRLTRVLTPFRAYECIPGEKGIYFSARTPEGEQLRYYDGKVLLDIGEACADPITREQLPKKESDFPFFSFGNFNYPEIAKAKGVELRVDDGSDPLKKLIINGRPYMAFTLGEGHLGSYYCSGIHRSAFLPGDRYFLLNTTCENYYGQLLIDVASGRYTRLPPHGRVQNI